MPPSTYRVIQYGTGAYSEVVHSPLAQYESVAEIEANYTWPSPDWWDHSGIPGQITAWPGGRVTVENAACADLVLITRGDGEITLSGIKRDGEIKTIQQGGPIRFLDDGE